MTNLPSGWAKTTIGTIAKLVNGRAFRPSDWSPNGLPIIRIQNLNRPDAQFNYVSSAVSSRHIVQNGDLLFAWSGTPGTSFGAHIWQGPTAALNQHIFNIRVDTESIDREFLRLAINQTLNQQIAKAHGGAGLRHVTKKAFESTEIALPPLAEQRRITKSVQRLEERATLIRSNLSEIARLVEWTRAALLQGAYSLTILPADHPNRYGRQASMVAVEEIATEVTYGTSSKSEKQGVVPVLRMGNIQSGEISWTDLVYTSDPLEIERYALRPNDVLFNRTNSPQLVGKTAVYHGERAAIFAGYLIRVRCSDRMLPDYLAICLNSPSGREYCQRVKSDGVSQSNINAKKLKAFRLPCPKIEDQSMIINLVHDGVARLAMIIDQIDQASTLLEDLYSCSVSQALAGRFGTGDDLDEPAPIQISRLKKARDEQQLDEGTIETEAASMKRNVTEILAQATGWLPSQEVARLYGITFGATPDEIEPFYSELRILDEAGQLDVEAITDDYGKKLGERLRLKLVA